MQTPLADKALAAYIDLAGRGGGGGLNTSGITNWIAQNIVPILLAGIGVLIIVGARKGRIGEGMTTLTIVIIGLIPIVAAGAFMAFGNNIANLVFG